MKIRFYLPPDNAEHQEVLRAFMEGTKKIDSDVSIGSAEECVEADIAVIFGVGKKAVPQSKIRGMIFDRREYLGKPTIVLEKGYVKRDLYYAAGWDGLNGRANFMNNNMPLDRWNALGVDLEPYTLTGSDLLICGQVPWDASVQHIDYIQWLGNLIGLLNKMSSRKIVLRPHPLAVKATPSFINSERSDHSLEYDLDRAFCVLTLNSNTGVDALIAGKPVFSFDCGSMIYNVSNRDLEKIENPQLLDRQQWANNIAYAQWTLEEMADGRAWLHLTTNIKK
jgi:hypothetical protein